MLVWPGSVTSIITGTRTRLFRGQNPLFGCCLPESWQPCCILNLGVYILGGGIAISAPKIQNGYKRILQVMLLLIMRNLTDDSSVLLPCLDGACALTFLESPLAGAVSFMALCCYLYNGSTGAALFLHLFSFFHINSAFYFLLTFLIILVLDELVFEARVERSEKNDNLCVIRE